MRDNSIFAASDTVFHHEPYPKYNASAPDSQVKTGLKSDSAVKSPSAASGLFKMVWS